MSDGDTLRVLTWNILYETSPMSGGSGEARWPLAVRGLRDAKADLVALQEVLPGRLAAISRDLPGYAMTVSEPGGVDRPIAPLLTVAALAALAVLVRRARRRDHDPAARYAAFRRWRGRAVGAALWAIALGLPAALASGSWHVGGYGRVNERLVLLHRPEALRLVDTRTLWFSPTPDRPGSRDPLAFEPRIAQLGVYARLAQGDTIAVLNVHAGHAASTHARDAALLLRVLEGPGRARVQVMLGDFNASAETRRLADLRAAGFRDAWMEAPARAGAPGTFHGWRAPGARIDHVLVRGPIRVLRAETRGVAQGELAASDHDAVIVDLAP